MSMTTRAFIVTCLVKLPPSRLLARNNFRVVRRPATMLRPYESLPALTLDGKMCPPTSAETLGGREPGEVSSWRLDPRSDSAPRFGAGIPHMLHQETLCAALVVVARGYNANCARAVLA